MPLSCHLPDWRGVATDTDSGNAQKARRGRRGIDKLRRDEIERDVFSR
jgi:hypothetical protein